MAYKRYFYRNGNKFGPYYYESYRDETGKVRKKYIGTVLPEKQRENKRKLITPTTILISLAILSLFLILGIMIYRQSITGKLIFLQEESLVINLKQGELLPINSKLVIEQNNSVKEILLSGVIESNAQGNFYIENKEISGEGEGYGIEGEKTTYPIINFKFKLISREAEESAEEQEAEETKEAAEEPEESIENESLPKQTDNSASEPSQESPSEPPLEPPTEPTSETELTITGEDVLEQEIEGQVSKDSPFTYNLDSEEYDVEITEVGKGSLNDLKIQKENSILTITTDYYEIEKGFGKDFLTNKTTSIEIGFDEIGVAKENLVISLVYQDALLAEASKGITENITMPEKNVTETNITSIRNLSITTKQYKAVINRPVKWLKIVNLNETEAGSLAIELPKQAENITIKTGQEVQQALQEIEEYEQVIEHADRKDLTTSKITGDVSLEIKKSRGILIRIWNLAIKISFTGKVIQEQDIQEQITETNDNKLVDLAEIANQTPEGQDIAVEYYTEAPRSFENEISENKKQIIISAPSELNYIDILAFTELPKEASPEEVKLYHLTETGREEVAIDKYDLNENNLTDYIEWLVPHLSNQTYELIIEISKAEHLDENRSFISDIYPDVYQLDNNWSEPIKNNEYVRVTFKQNLTREKDITIYARHSNVTINNNSVPYDIYQKKKRIDEINSILNNG